MLTYLTTNWYGNIIIDSLTILSSPPSLACTIHTGPDMVDNPTVNPIMSTSLNAARVTQPVAPVPPPAAKVCM